MCKASQILLPSTPQALDIHWDTSVTNPGEEKSKDVTIPGLFIKINTLYIYNALNNKGVCFIYPIAFDSFHKEIWYPQSEEEISGSLLLFTCVLLQLQKIKHIKMPRLEVDSEGPRSLHN